jgi:hypothetical protein
MGRFVVGLVGVFVVGFLLVAGALVGSSVVGRGDIVGFGHAVVFILNQPPSML